MILDYAIIGIFSIYIYIYIDYTHIYMYTYTFAQTLGPEISAIDIPGALENTSLLSSCLREEFKEGPFASRVCRYLEALKSWPHLDT